MFASLPFSSFCSLTPTLARKTRLLEIRDSLLISMKVLRSLIYSYAVRGDLNRLVSVRGGEVRKTGEGVGLFLFSLNQESHGSITSD